MFGRAARSCASLDDFKYMTKKFDVIIGNPPYNRGLVKQTHSVYKHIAMNSEKEGYIGFFISSLDLLSDDGILTFISPGKFMVGPGTKNFRKWVINNYDLERIDILPVDTFDGVGIDKIVVTTIKNQSYNGKTTIISLNGSIVEMDVRENNDLVIPDFGNQNLYEIYKRLSKDFDFIPAHNSGSVGEYGGKSKDSFSEVQTAHHPFKVITSIDNSGNTVSKFTNLQSIHSKFWRITAKNSFQRGFGLVEPGEEVDFSMWAMNCSNESEARTMVAWTKTKLFRLIWDAFKSTRHTHVIIRNIPKPQQGLTEVDIYDSFNLTQDEILYIESMNNE